MAQEIFDGHVWVPEGMSAEDLVTSDRTTTH
jgi:hypothetical protein